MKKLLAILLLSSVSAWAGYTYTIKEGDSLNKLSLHNYESLLMTGGFLQDLTLLDHSSAYFQNQIPEYDFTTIFLQTYGESQAEINGGRFYQCYTGSESSVSVYGGVLGWIIAEQNSQVYLYGGNVYDYLKVSGGNPIFHIYGYNLNITSLEYRDKITGNWANGSALNLLLYRDSRTGVNTRNYVVLHEIPEPTTLLLLGLGGLLIRRKK